MAHKTVAYRVRDILDKNTQELDRCGEQSLTAADIKQLAEDHQAQSQLERERELNAYKEARRAEYPAIGDQLDAILKGLAGLDNVGQPLIELQQRIAGIKSKYPKPLA